VINSHSGNIHLRSLTDGQTQDYLKAKTKAERRQIAFTIYDAIKSLDPPGRFLIEDPLMAAKKDGNPITSKSVWMPVEKDKAVDKILNLMVRQMQGKKADNRGYRQQNAFKGSFMASKSVIDLEISAGREDQILPIMDANHTIMHGTNARSTRAIEMKTEEVGRNLQFTDTKTEGVQNGNDKQFRELEILTEKVNQNLISLDAVLDDKLLASTEPIMLSDMSAKGLDQNLRFVDSKNVGMLNGNPNSVKAFEMSVTQKNGNLQFLDGKVAYLNDANKSNESNMTTSVAFGMSADGIDQNLHSHDTNHFGMNSSNTISGGRHESSARGIGQDSPILIGEHLRLIDAKAKSIGSKELTNREVNHNLQLLDRERMEVQSFEIDRLKSSNFFQLHEIKTDISGGSQTTQNLVQITLREWIEISSPKRNGFVAVEEVPDYIEAALHVALELARCLARSEEFNNDGISLASISAENVQVQVAPKRHAWLPQNIKDYGDGTDDRCRHNIHGVLYLPSTDSTAGCNSSRLFALGVVFLELFSYGTEILSGDVLKSIQKSAASSSMAMMCINIDDSDVPPSGRPRKRSAVDKNDSNYADQMHRLKSLGVHDPICVLLRNLLDCVNGDFCGNEAYKTFADVKLDLEMMIDVPLRFLRNCDAGQSCQIERGDILFGREECIKQLNDAYKRSCSGEFNGVLIRGEAGVGKSKLSTIIEQIARDSNGYFLRGKFDQNHEIKPLSVIGHVFNNICNMIAVDIFSFEDEIKLAKSLESALGSRAWVLAQIVPSLSKLMPLQQLSCVSLQSVDLAESVRYLLSTLLSTITKHFGKPIFIVFDDVQWADAASLQMFTSLLYTKKNVFFAFCCRDGDTSIQAEDPFQVWLQSISVFSLQQIHVTNLDYEGVNNLISHDLCVSPRLTRPLSKIIFNKSLGNPFFVWRLLESLKKNEMIYFSRRESRFAWDIDKISDLEISDDVLSLLIMEMKKLPSDIQMGLKVFSCIGASVNEAVIETLSSHLAINLGSILDDATRKCYMDKVAGTKKYRFVHDRVQQAAYEMIPEEDRRLYHMNFGLSICSHVLNGENDDLFFTSVNQMNQGGPEILADPSQKPVIARLNLNAGAKCIELSDYASAIRYFTNGVAFLGPNHWNDQYDLSIELYDSAADAACNLSDLVLAEDFAKTIIHRAKWTEHKLNAFYVMSKTLRKKSLLRESIHYVLSVLNELGEDTTPIGEETQLIGRIRSIMNSIASFPDETILSFKMAERKQFICCMNLYSELLYLYHLTAETKKLFEVTLTMVQLTMKNGLTVYSPASFANFGLAAVAVGNYELGYRLGSLALKLSQRINAAESASNIMAVVKWFIAWAFEPLQSISESLEIGYNLGNQTGDVYSAIMNKNFSFSAMFLSGKNLVFVRNQTAAFIKELRRRKQEWCVNALAITHSISSALIEGLGVPWSIENEDTISAQGKKRNNKALLLNYRCHQLMKAFFFRLDDKIRSTACILDELTLTEAPLRPTFIVAVFFEGLACYRMERKSRDKKWMTRGGTALSFIKTIGQSSPWNFENKMFLLEAEKMYTIGAFQQSKELYEKAILSAKTHKFIHEEALSHELAGFMHLENQMPREAVEYFAEAVSCYTNWGALALANQLDSVANKARGALVTNSLQPNDHNSNFQFS